VEELQVGSAPTVVTSGVIAPVIFKADAVPVTRRFPFTAVFPFTEIGAVEFPKFTAVRDDPDPKFAVSADSLTVLMAPNDKTAPPGRAKEPAPLDPVVATRIPPGVAATLVVCLTFELSR
jgi:hypothetical protein